MILKVKIINLSKTKYNKFPRKKLSFHLLSFFSLSDASACSLHEHFVTSLIVLCNWMQKGCICDFIPALLGK